MFKYSTALVGVVCRLCVAVCSHPGTGKYFTVTNHATGLVMQVDGEVIDVGSRVVMADPVVSKVKGRGSGSVPLRQQFCRDEMVGVVRSAFRFYCLDIDHGLSRYSLLSCQLTLLILLF